MLRVLACVLFGCVTAAPACMPETCGIGGVRTVRHFQCAQSSEKVVEVVNMQLVKATSAAQCSTKGAIVLGSDTCTGTPEATRALWHANVLAVCKGKTSCDVSIAAMLGCPETGPCLPVTALACPGYDATTEFDLALELKCDGSDPFAITALAFIAIVTFSVSVTLTKEDFIAADKRGVGIGMLSQFGVMPLLCFIMAHLFGFDNQVSAGLVLVGCAPGGSTSNLFTYFSGGSVALSIVMSCCSTLAATFMMPLLLLIYVESSFVDSSFQIPFTGIIGTLALVLVFAFLGLLVRAKNTTWQCKGKFLWQWAEKIGSSLGAIVLVVAIVQGVRGNPEIMNPSSYPYEWVCAVSQPALCLTSLSHLQPLTHRRCSSGLAQALAMGWRPCAKWRERTALQWPSKLVCKTIRWW